MGQAFLEVDSPVQRRPAHTPNGSFITVVQLRLHFSSQQGGLSDTGQMGNCSTYEVASYLRHRQVVAARGRAGVMQAGAHA